jgi:hypothetical protein
VIRKDDEFLAATERAQELMGFTDGSAEEREMEELADAMQVYENSLAMLRGVANRAADTPEKDVPTGVGFE